MHHGRCVWACANSAMNGYPADTVRIMGVGLPSVAASLQVTYHTYQGMQGICMCYYDVQRALRSTVAPLELVW
jgi:hypothetical protein